MRSTDGLAEETHGHIISAGCEGMATTITAAHHIIRKHLYDSMHAAQKPKSKLKFVALDKESNMSTLWLREECLKICIKEGLAEKAQDIYRGDNSSQKKSRGTVQPRSRVFLRRSFLGQATDRFAIN